MCVWLPLVLFGAVFGQTLHSDRRSPNLPEPPLDAEVEHFDITDGILRKGISELSLKEIDGLHLGFEEALRDKLHDPIDRSVKFSLHLENKSLREILDALCQLDRRYAWSVDGATVNVYPRTMVADSSYLLNLRIDKISLNQIPDPDQALTPLSEQISSQQVGYMQMGGG